LTALRSSSMSILSLVLMFCYMPLAFSHASSSFSKLSIWFCKFLIRPSIILSRRAGLPTTIGCLRMPKLSLASGLVA